MEIAVLKSPLNNISISHQIPILDPSLIHPMLPAHSAHSCSHSWRPWNPGFLSSSCRYSTRSGSTVLRRRFWRGSQEYSSSQWAAYSQILQWVLWSWSSFDHVILAWLSSNFSPVSIPRYHLAYQCCRQKSSRVVCVHLMPIIILLLIGLVSFLAVI